MLFQFGSVGGQRSWLVRQLSMLLLAKAACAVLIQISSCCSEACTIFCWMLLELLHNTPQLRATKLCVCSDGGGVWGVWGPDGAPGEGCPKRGAKRAGQRRHQPPPTTVARSRGGEAPPTTSWVRPGDHDPFSCPFMTCRQTWFLLCLNSVVKSVCR